MRDETESKIAGQTSEQQEISPIIRFFGTVSQNSVGLLRTLAVNVINQRLPRR